MILKRSYTCSKSRHHIPKYPKVGTKCLARLRFNRQIHVFPPCLITRLADEVVNSLLKYQVDTDRNWPYHNDFLIDMGSIQPPIDTPMTEIAFEQGASIFSCPRPCVLQ